MRSKGEAVSKGNNLKQMAEKDFPQSEWEVLVWENLGWCYSIRCGDIEIQQGWFGPDSNYTAYHQQTGKSVTKEYLKDAVEHLIFDIRNEVRQLEACLNSINIKLFK